MKTPAGRIYLDYSATTPIDPAVASVVSHHLSETYGNASSVHSFGRSAKVILEESRETIAAALGAENGEIFFTSGGTESDNHAVIGTAFARRRKEGKDHLIVSSVEHHAVLDAAEYLRGHGFSVSLVPVDAGGRIDPEAVRKLITPKTSLISVMHANNETGVLQPIAAISAIAQVHGIPVHTDAVQTFGKIPVRVNDLGADILSLSAHKIYGPKGIGAVYIKKGTDLDPLVHGGAQERNVRAGTENIPLIAGFAAAAAAIDTYREQTYRNAVEFRTVLKSHLQSALPGVVFNGADETSLPHIVSVSLDAEQYRDIESESLLLNMDLNGIAVSSGSACTSGSIQPSHVLLAMGRDERTSRATVRFSFGKFTTIEEVTKAGEMLCSIVTSIHHSIH